MRRKYLVLPIEGNSGIQKMSDSPVGRRTYVPGDIIELDDTVNDVAGLKGRGQITEYSEPKNGKEA
jgi:hypothetical protein